MGAAKIKGSLALTLTKSDEVPEGVKQKSNLTVIQNLLNRNSVEILKEVSAFYTPNNDYEFLWQGLTSGNIPDAIIMITEGPLFVGMQAPIGQVFGEFIDGLAYLEFSNFNKRVNAIYLDSRTGTIPSPYQSPDPVEYYLLVLKNL